MEKAMFLHRHISMKTLQQQIREDIARQGFSLRHVVSSNQPEWTYTVGLHTKGSSRPELFMSGLSRKIRVAWMLHLGFLIQGPPPLVTRQRQAQAEGVAVEALSFPAGGSVFIPGLRYLDLAAHRLPTCFGEVEAHYYEEYLGQAIVFHHTSTFPVLQVVWSDPQGQFPWERGADPRFQSQQRLLFQPERYLPLRTVTDEHQ
jgi:hypothetical protein